MASAANWIRVPRINSMYLCCAKRGGLIIRFFIIFLLLIAMYQVILKSKSESNDVIWKSREPSSNNCRNNLLYERNSHEYGKAHIYRSFVNIRFIILTYNRPKSLAKVLRSLQDQELDGHTGSVDIWIDRSVAGEVHNQTLSVAGDFCWNRGATTVHVHSKHVGLYGQWMNTWRPPNPAAGVSASNQTYKAWGVPSRVSANSHTERRRTETLAIMLEDDVDVSRFAYRWLRAAHVRYGGREDVFGYGLQDENAIVARGKGKFFEIPRADKRLVFGYVIPGTWGLAPHPARWREMVTWFHARYNRRRPGFSPLTEGADMYNTWYHEIKSREKQVTTLVSLWLARFASERKLVTINSNLPQKLGYVDSSLVANRREKGVHYAKKGRRLRYLMTSWNKEALKFPKEVKVYGYNGHLISKLSQW